MVYFAPRLLIQEVVGVNFNCVRLEGTSKASEEEGTDSHTGLQKEIYFCERLNRIRGGTMLLTSPLPVLISA